MSFYNLLPFIKSLFSLLFYQEFQGVPGEIEEKGEKSIGLEENKRVGCLSHQNEVNSQINTNKRVDISYFVEYTLS